MVAALLYVLPITMVQPLMAFIVLTMYDTWCTQAQTPVHCIATIVLLELTVGQKPQCLCILEKLVLYEGMA